MSNPNPCDPMPEGVNEEEVMGALKRLSVSFRFDMSLGGMGAMFLVGQIQLACRHPTNLGPSRKFVQSLAERIGREMVEAEPCLAPVIAAGWKGE